MDKPNISIRKRLCQLEMLSPSDWSPVTFESLETMVRDLLVNQLLVTSDPEMISVNQSKVLSDRELEILRLIANGLSNKEFAERLFLAISTVKWYLSEIYSKMNVASRTQAVVRGRDLHLLS